MRAPNLVHLVSVCMLMLNPALQMSSAVLVAPTPLKTILRHMSIPRQPLWCWPFYARVWCSPLSMLRSPFGAVMLVNLSFALDVC